jgi:hypothetical protein
VFSPFGRVGRWAGILSPLARSTTLRESSPTIGRDSQRTAPGVHDKRRQEFVARLAQAGLALRRVDSPLDLFVRGVPVANR